MTARVALSCDGTFDDGRMPCRGAISFSLEAIADAAGLLGTDLVDVDAARELAHGRGWSSTTAGDYCPAHGRRRAAALELALEAWQPAPPRPATPFADAARGLPTCLCPIGSTPPGQPRTHRAGCPHAPGRADR